MYHHDIELPLKKHQYWAPISLHTTERDGETFLYLYNNGQHEILGYNLYKGQLQDSISLIYRPLRDIWAFRYVSSDSIFVICNAAAMPQYNHDSTALRLDATGKIREVYSFAGAPVWSTQNPRYGKDSVSYVEMFSSHTEYFDQKLLVTLQRYNQALGDTMFSEYPSPAAGHIDVGVPGGRFMAHPISLPSEIGKFYPREMNRTHIAVNNTGEVIYGFHHVPDLYVVRPEEGSVKHYPIKSTLLDSVEPLPADFNPLQQRRPSYDLKKGAFGNVLFDPYRNIYFRFNRLGQKPDALVNTPIQIAFWVLDSAFNLIGEGLMPDSLSYACVFARPEGVYFWNYSESKSPEKKMTFSLYTFAPSKNMKQSEPMRPAPIYFQGGGVQRYASQHFQLDMRNMAILFVPVNHACEGCSHEIIRYYNNNYEKLKRHRVYLILAGDKGMIDFYLNANNVSPNVRQTIYMDTRQAYAQFIEGIPRQGILWMRNNKRVEEFLMDPAELILLPERIEAYFDHH